MEDHMMDQYEKIFGELTEEDVRYYSKKMREKIILSQPVKIYLFPA
jgi:hypothetical protein